MTHTDLNRRLLEWAGWHIDLPPQYNRGIPPGGMHTEPLPDTVNDHAALLGLLGRLTESEKRLFSASLIDLLGLDGDENGRFYFSHAITFATAPLPVLAECLWRVVGTTKEIK